MFAGYRKQDLTAVAPHTVRALLHHVSVGFIYWGEATQQQTKETLQ